EQFVAPRADLGPREPSRGPRPGARDPVRDVAPELLRAHAQELAGLGLGESLPGHPRARRRHYGATATSTSGPRTLSLVHPRTGALPAAAVRREGPARRYSQLSCRETH